MMPACKHLLVAIMYPLAQSFLSINAAEARFTASCLPALDVERSVCVGWKVSFAGDSASFVRTHIPGVTAFPSLLSVSPRDKSCPFGL